MNDDLSIFTIEDLQEMIESAEEMYRIVIKAIDHLPLHDQPSYKIMHCNELKRKIELYKSEIESRKKQCNEDLTKGNLSMVNIIKEGSSSQFKESQDHMNPVKKILILSANPEKTGRLRLDKEIREIEEGLKLSERRDQFHIQSKWAVRYKDLRRALWEYKPHIVHFAGHGEEYGLMVESEEGLAVPISSKALSGLFELCSHHVECVILNACYSALQADTIIKHINYVIGMPGKIDDQAAIEFAVGFYDALGAGNTVEKAFKFGCNAVEQVFPDLPKHLLPVLKKRTP